MADVLDVVQRLNYDVNTGGLQQASAEIENQVREIGNLSIRLDKLQQAYNQTSAQDIQRRQRINALIVEQKKRIDSVSDAYAKQLVTLNKVGTVQKKQFDQLGFSIRQILREAPAAGVGIETFFIAIGNNIAGVYDAVSAKLRVLKEEGKPTSSIFSQIGKEVFSLNSLISVGLPLLLIFGDELLKIAGFGKEASTSLDDYNKSLQEVTKSALKAGFDEISQLRVLEATATDTAAAQETRLRAAQKLQDLYPSILANYSKEAILNNEAAEAINKVSDALLSRAYAEAAAQKVSLSAQRTYEKELQIRKVEADLRNAEDKANELSQVTNRNQFAQNAVTRAFQRTETLRKERDELRKERDELKKETEGYINDRKTFLREASGILGDEAVIGNVSTDKVKEERKKKIKEQRDYIKEFSKESAGSIEEAFSNLEEETKKLQEALGSDYYNSPEYKKFQLDFQTNAAKQKEKNDKEAEKKEDELDKKRQERLKKYVSAYQQAAQTVAQVLNNQLQYEISVVDRQIQTQERRVDEAEKLAERGNVETLRLERERLTELTRQRENFARRQQAINAILTLSNSILAVATAAGESGAGAIAVVPAVIAAIAAGYGAVTSLFRSNEMEGFKDGVIGYEGKGNGTSDSNIVRISRGESVITAKATAENRHWLEMMNKGYSMPDMIRGYSGRGSKEDRESKELLRGIKHGIENFSVNAKQVMDAYGLSQVIETTRSKDKRARM